MIRIYKLPMLILVVEGDWNAEVGENAQKDRGEVCGPFCSLKTNDRGLRLLDCATYSNFVLANTIGNHKPFRRRTWLSPDGTHHKQIDIFGEETVPFSN